MASHPSEEFDEIDIIAQDNAKPVAPVQFLGPSGLPAGTHDFRPVPFVFKDDEERTEDGHGNMRRSTDRVVPHPSQAPRRTFGSGPAQSELDLNAAPEPPLPQDPPPTEVATTPAKDEPKKAPGIAGSKQEQPQEK